jgi:sugar phosphate isomerase/epimerase
MQDISRRALLGGTAALGLGAVAATPASADSDRLTGRVPRGAISIQLYTLRRILATDLEGTLAALAGIGYRKVELAGLHGRTPVQFRAVLDRVGLHATSGHVGLGSNWQQAMQDALTLGQRFIVMPFANFRTAAEWRAMVAELNLAGELARQAGLRFGYHNHAAEFATLPSGERPWDIIVNETDPKLVHLQLDLYWAVTGGQDPVALIHANRHRILQFHVKDRAANGSFADLGRGTIDFPRIFAHAREAGVLEYIVEHDQPPSPLDTARVGFEYLRNLRFCR